MDKSFSGLENIVKGELGILGFLGPLDDLLVKVVGGIGIVKNLHKLDLEEKLVAKAVSVVSVVSIHFMLILDFLLIIF